MSYFDNPHPRNWNLGTPFVFKIGAFIGAFVFLFLYIFKPDNLIGTANIFTLFTCSVYGLISFLTPSFVMLFTPMLFPDFCKEEEWNIKKEFIINITIVLLITLFVNLFFFLFSGINFDLFKLIRVIGLVFLISVIPVLALISFNQNRWLKQYIEDSKEINEKITTSHHSTNSENSSVTIEGQGKNEKLILKIDDILFISSQGNYCEIIREINGKLDKKLIRISIANIGEQLHDFTKIEKVHRSFLVNLENVKNVRGNAQGYKLYFEKSKTVVPVSRSKSKEIKNKLITLSES